jgi:uncharacterized protein YnzC (UPF0291/DUF896 family)
MDSNLVSEEQQGFNKPNRIYVLTPKPLDKRTIKNYQSRVSKVDSQECQKVKPNKLNAINKDSINKRLTTSPKVGVCASQNNKTSSNLTASENFEDSRVKDEDRNAELTKCYLSMYKVVFKKKHRAVKKDIVWSENLSEFENKDIANLMVSYLINVRDNLSAKLVARGLIDYSSKFVEWDGVDDTHTCTYDWSN